MFGFKFPRFRTITQRTESEAGYYFSGEVSVKSRGVGRRVRLWGNMHLHGTLW